ncbi:AlpA family phage regulatory protein [Ottowia sp.]|uniref:helix-turn-helix transcriptional regulator n=1 Tax=Ottowia sp. TaxID=1898956 RepID=UPI002BEFF835|nr:AlpA family phage regulatory protein [Ottowia sp.]HOB66637.1 AlpA family phage regulatory protein [Ottowia sp.]HPZ56469.1 AlpA family phage regulatory protein [Ottowia sp.]HQD47633.1 AlpA family phage regulatory protein [Ottowia sp.]
MHASVRIGQAAAILGTSKSTVWRMIKNDSTFPRPRKLSPRCTVFDVGELLAWRDSKVVAANDQTAEPAPAAGKVHAQNSA